MGIIGVLATLAVTVLVSVPEVVLNKGNSSTNVSANSSVISDNIFDIGGGLKLLSNDPAFQIYLFISAGILVGIWLFCLVIVIVQERETSEFQYPNISNTKRDFLSGKTLNKVDLIKNDTTELFGITEDLHVINSGFRKGLIYSDLVLYLDISALLGVLICATSKNMWVSFGFFMLAIIILVILWIFLRLTLSKADSKK